MRASTIGFKLWRLILDNRLQTRPASVPAIYKRNEALERLVVGCIVVVFWLTRFGVKAQADQGATPSYFPPPESQGGWRKLEKADDVRRLAGMDPVKLPALREWLRKSDDRKFAAVIIRRGYIVLEEERGASSVTSVGNVKSSAKAVCATVLAIASEESQQDGRTPRKMKFDDSAFDFIPMAQPLSDPRKAKITVRQLLNHTSGIAPESSGARNVGPWEYVMGHTGDARTARLAFDPGTDLDYSTHGLYHAALVCENVTGVPYDRYAVEHLFKPLGIERSWFEFFDGGEKYGRHPSHGLGLPAREMARIAYCMAHEGRWGERQVIPRWFVEETARPTHAVRGRRALAVMRSRGRMGGRFRRT
jgi:CubicO group peptidase (beta-lactamase class C family)